MDSDLRTRRGRLRGFSINRLIPNVLTLAALCSGLTAIRFGLQGEMRLAVIAIFVAASSMPSTAGSRGGWASPAGSAPS